jgi:hypothetical protein
MGFRKGVYLSHRRRRRLRFTGKSSTLFLRPDYTICLFRCPASFIYLLFEFDNLFYYLSLVLSAPLYFKFKVLDNSTVGVKHLGVECRGCGQGEIAGLRWQCLDCPTPFDLCTFCFTNGKHYQRNVYFRRFHHPSSDPYIIIYFILII